MIYTVVFQTKDGEKYSKNFEAPTPEEAAEQVKKYVKKKKVSVVEPEETQD